MSEYYGEEAEKALSELARPVGEFVALNPEWEVSVEEALDGFRCAYQERMLSLMEEPDVDFCLGMMWIRAKNPDISPALLLPSLAQVVGFAAKHYGRREAGEIFEAIFERLEQGSGEET